MERVGDVRGGKGGGKGPLTFATCSLRRAGDEAEQGVNYTQKDMGPKPPRETAGLRDNLDVKRVSNICGGMKDNVGSGVRLVDALE